MEKETEKERGDEDMEKETEKERGDPGTRRKKRTPLCFLKKRYIILFYHVNTV